MLGDDRVDEVDNYDAVRQQSENSDYGFFEYIEFVDDEGFISQSVDVVAVEDGGNEQKH